MAVKYPWGNPASSRFAHRNIRLVAADELRVHVHAELKTIVWRLLTDLSEQGLAVSRLEGHPTHPDGTRLTLELVAIDAAATAGAMDLYGFRAEGDNVYAWAGTVEDARAKTEIIFKVEQMAVDGTAAATEPAPAADGVGGTPEAVTEAYTPAPLDEMKQAGEWREVMPGSRTIAPGDVGRDVLFIQALFGAPRTGIYDEATEAAVQKARVVRGLELEGHVDDLLLRTIIPRLKPRLHPGDAGRSVRVASAAMIAGGYQPIDSAVESRFGVALSGYLRAVRVEMGVRPTAPRIGGIEWEWLIQDPRR